MKNENEYVLVTTENRGVFFGKTTGGRGTQDSITLTDTQMCIRWEAAVHGVLGLAATGPTPECRISPIVPGETTLYSITGVFAATDRAVEEWQKCYWG